MQDTEYKLCPHTDCVYHAPAYAANGCDYFIIQCERGTPIGQRLRGCPAGKNCTRYEKGSKKRRASQTPLGIENIPVDPAEATALWNAGKTDTEIAAIMKLPRIVVSKYLRAHGMKPQRSVSPAFQIDMERAMKMIEEGATDVQIGEALGVPTHQVMLWRHDHDIDNVKVRRGTLSRVDYAAIERGYRMGMTDRAITIFADCSESSVKRWRAAHNAPRNTGMRKPD